MTNAFGRASDARSLFHEGDLRGSDRPGIRREKPARKLILPKELRPVDRTTLTWDQLRLVLASVTLRDRILLTLDMTETFRSSELFALRWSGFDRNGRKLTVSQTAYRGKLRDYGKTKKSLRPCMCRKGWGTSCGFGSNSTRARTNEKNEL